MKAYRKLRLRMLIVCAASTGLVLAGMAFVSYQISVGHLQTQFSEIFANNVSSVQSYIREQPVITHTWLLETEQASNLVIGVESDQGYRLYTGLDIKRDALTVLALQTAAVQYGFDPLSKPNGDWREASAVFFIESGQGRYRVSVSRVSTGDDWLTVMLLKDRAGEFKQIASLRLGFVVAAAVATVCLIAFAWFFSAWTVRPAEESRKQQAAFVAAASHEYRSPVAVIQMAAENLEKAPSDVAGRFVKMILRECGRLGRLTQDMLQLAGADYLTLNMRAEQVNPDANEPETNTTGRYLEEKVNFPNLANIYAIQQVAPDKYYVLGQQQGDPAGAWCSEDGGVSWQTSRHADLSGLEILSAAFTPDGNFYISIADISDPENATFQCAFVDENAITVIQDIPELSAYITGMVLTGSGDLLIDNAFSFTQVNPETGKATKYELKEGQLF